MYLLSHIIPGTRHVEEPDARPTMGARSGSGGGRSGGRRGGRGRGSRPGGPLPTTTNNGLGIFDIATISTAVVNAATYGIGNSCAHIGGPQLSHPPPYPLKLLHLQMICGVVTDIEIPVIWGGSGCIHKTNRPCPPGTLSDVRYVHLPKGLPWALQSPTLQCNFI